MKQNRPGSNIALTNLQIYHQTDIDRPSKSGFSFDDAEKQTLLAKTYTINKYAGMISTYTYRNFQTK